MLAVALGESDGFSSALPEKIQFCSPCLTASHRPDIYDVRRMNREDSLYALSCDNPPYGEGLVNAASLSGNYRAGEYLDSFFIAFFNPAAYINHIAYFEIRHILLQALIFDCIQYFSFHRSISCKSGKT
jgi:hypothetical protein